MTEPIQDLASQIAAKRESERDRLEKIRDYLRDDPDKRNLPGLPQGSPYEMVRIARISRVNFLKFVLTMRTEGLFVDAFRTPDEEENLDVWNAWERNRLSARQIGVHRSALAFGASYVTVFPGDPVPVIRGVSPRNLTALYADDDDDWPVAALQDRGRDRFWLWREGLRFDLVREKDQGFLVVGAPVSTGTDMPPIVRFRDTFDLDKIHQGIIEGHILVQDQINFTTFGLLVAQHYTAWKMRYVVGWSTEDEKKLAKASASMFMTFKDKDVSVGELGATDLRQYIESRQSSMRHLATLSQTPIPELMGELVNLSAEALESTRASHHSALMENREVFSEGWEQVLTLAGQFMGIDVPPAASVHWRDTSIRSLGDAVDGLGGLAERLGVPVRELWHRIPDVTPAELERWRQAAESDAELSSLVGVVERLREAGDPPSPAPQPADD